MLVVAGGLRGVWARRKGKRYVQLGEPSSRVCNPIFWIADVLSVPNTFPTLPYLPANQLSSSGCKSPLPEVRSDS